MLALAIIKSERMFCVIKRKSAEMHAAVHCNGSQVMYNNESAVKARVSRNMQYTSSILLNIDQTQDHDIAKNPQRPAQ